jgi:phosphate transport system protein
MADDLRATISAIRLSGDLERIGDLAKNVGKRVLAIAGQFQPQKIVLGVQHMSDLVQEQLKDVLDAYAQQDPAAAMSVGSGTTPSTPSTPRCSRASHLHDGGPAQHHLLHASPLLRQEHRAHRRPHHEHRRDDPLPSVTGDTLAAERPKNDRSSFATLDAEA